MPCKDLKIESSNFMLSAFLCDVILTFHKKKLNQGFESSFPSHIREIAYILTHYTEWLEKMYAISCEYKICAPELIIPYDIECFLKKIDDITHKSMYAYIPNFIEYETTYGFCGASPNQNEILLMVDIVHKDYDIKQILTAIQNALTIARYKAEKTLTPAEIEIMENMPRDEDHKTTYDIAISRLLGLLNWDLRLKGAKLQEVRDKARELKFIDCPPNQQCSDVDKAKKCPDMITGKCKNKLSSQLSTASLSIKKREQCPTTSDGSEYPYKGKRLKIPRITLHVEEGSNISLATFPR